MSCVISLLFLFVVAGLEKGYWETSSDDGQQVDECHSDPSIEQKTSNDATSALKKNTNSSSDWKSANNDTATHTKIKKSAAHGESDENRIKSKNKNTSATTVKTDSFADRTSESNLNTSTMQQVCYAFHSKHCNVYYLFV